MKKVGLASLMVSIILVFSACSKNQKAVNGLYGIWNLVKINNESIIEEDMLTYVFSECKLNKTEYCDLTSISYNGGMMGKYKVTDKGRTLFLDALFEGEIIELKSEIIELTGSQLVIKFDTGDQETYEFKKK